eukprot:174068-Chlamydomonas_euryale.AAC.1
MFCSRTGGGQDKRGRGRRGEDGVSQQCSGSFVDVRELGQGGNTAGSIDAQLFHRYPLNPKTPCPLSHLPRHR